MTCDAFSHFLQCNAEVEKGDELLHIISHYKPVTLLEICNYIPAWVRAYETFKQTISKDILEWKKLTLQDYVSAISTPGVPVDEIGLLMLCRLYHLELCVLLENHYWCALNRSSVENSKIIVIFRGKLKFSGTINCTEKYESQEYHLRPCKHLDVLPCPAKKDKCVAEAPTPTPTPEKDKHSEPPAKPPPPPRTLSLKLNL